MRVRTNFLIFKSALFLFPLCIAPNLYYWLVYVFGIITLSDFLDFFVIFYSLIIALFVYFGNQRDSHNNKLEEQTSIIGGLISELGTIKENINWYREEIENDSFQKLDHPTNKMHLENYLSRLNRKYFNEMGFALISNINDKIFQLNTRVSESRELNKKFNKGYCLGIIKEVLNKIDFLDSESNRQIQIISKEGI